MRRSVKVMESVDVYRIAPFTKGILIQAIDGGNICSRTFDLCTVIFTFTDVIRTDTPVQSILWYLFKSSGAV